MREVRILVVSSPRGENIPRGKEKNVVCTGFIKKTVRQVINSQTPKII